MSVANHASWLVLGLHLVCLVPACYSQNEKVLRKVQTPYPNWYSCEDRPDICSSLVTAGPGDTVEDGKYYRTLELIDDQLYVGGQATLLSLDPGNLAVLHNISLPATLRASCDYCDNYIRVIQNLTDDTLLECGTNFNNNPYCQQRSKTDLSEIGSRIEFSNDPSLVPFVYNQNSSWFLTEDFGLYVGTDLVRTAGMVTTPSIATATVSANSSDTTIDVQLTTLDDPSVLSKNGPPHPQFVGDPIIYNGRVYFFLREVAVEISEEIVYSRVAVMCQNDIGGQASTMFDEGNIVTFVKARITCSIDGKVPYHYNEIHDIYQSTNDSKVVFAAFATRAPTVASSAVCAYRLDEIEALFLSTGNKFLTQVINGGLWTPVDGVGDDGEPVTPRVITELKRNLIAGHIVSNQSSTLYEKTMLDKCQNDSNSYDKAIYSAILKRGQILSVAAENKLYYETTGGAVSNPLLVIDGERFSQIVVDENVVNSTDVMFIGTENGTVLKAHLNSNRSEAKVVEQIILDTKNHKTPVLAMQLSAADQAVFVGTDIGVFKIPFQHCGDFSTRQRCLFIEDPYCSWNGTSCVRSGEGEQDLESGAENNPAVPSITIHQAPQNKMRYLKVTKQPLNLYLFAEAPAGKNLRVVDNEVPCQPCTSLPYSEQRTSSSGKEFLFLLINGSNSTEDTNCSCSVSLAIDGGDTNSMNFTLTVDDSAAVNATKTDLEELEMFDKKIADYKRELENWKNKVGESCELQDVQLCDIDP